MHRDGATCGATHGVFGRRRRRQALHPLARIRDYPVNGLPLAQNTLRVKLTGLRRRVLLQGAVVIVVIVIASIVIAPLSSSSTASSPVVLLQTNKIILPNTPRIC